MSVKEQAMLVSGEEEYMAHPSHLPSIPPSVLAAIMDEEGEDV